MVASKSFDVRWWSEGVLVFGVKLNGVLFLFSFFSKRNGKWKPFKNQPKDQTQFFFCCLDFEPFGFDLLAPSGKASTPHLFDVRRVFVPVLGGSSESV